MRGFINFQKNATVETMAAVVAVFGTDNSDLTITPNGGGYVEVETDFDDLQSAVAALRDCAEYLDSGRLTDDDGNVLICVDGEWTPDSCSVATLMAEPDARYLMRGLMLQQDQEISSRIYYELGYDAAPNGYCPDDVREWLGHHVTAGSGEEE